jgi:hypothetical protein
MKNVLGGKVNMSGVVDKFFGERKEDALRYCPGPPGASARS